MSQRDLGAQTPPPLTDEAWHDKVLTDAIGYTRGLVTLLDSLTEAFRRRGRDLAEGRQRLEILQGERRKILEERAAFEDRIRALGGERDRARGDLELRSRELDQARADLKRSQEAAHAQGREIESLRASLTEASRQAARLDLAQKERQALLEERAALEEQARGLSSECDLLHAIVLEKDTQLAELRADAARARDQLAAHADELRSLQAALAGAGRQAEDLREIVRALERDRENTARRHAARLAEESQARERAVGEAARSRDESAALREALDAERDAMEAERAALREAAAAERLALREAMTAERLTLSADRDAARLEAEQRQRALADSQEELGRLQTAIQAASEALRERDARLEDLRHAADDLEARLRSVAAERDAARTESARLSADASALTAELAEAERELVRARDDRAAAASRAQHLQAELDEARSAAEHLRAQVRAQEGERDEWRALVLAAQEVVGATGPLPERLRVLVAEQGDLAGRVEVLAQESEALRGALVEATQRASLLEAERDQLAGQAALLISEVQALRASQAPAAAAPPEPQPDAAPPPPGPQPAPPAPTPPLANGRPRGQNGQGPGARKAATALDLRAVLLLTHEPDGAGGREPVQVSGPVSAVNHAGMVIALNQAVPVGQNLSAHLFRKGVTMTVPGSVVRTQPSSSGPGSPPMVDHLVRFEHPGPESPAQLKAFLA